MILADVFRSLESAENADSDQELDQDPDQEQSEIFSQPKMSFPLKISSAELSLSIDMDDAKLRHGWNRVGEYELGSGEVTVTVQPSEEVFVYADAIRWTPTKSRSDRTD